MFPPAPHLPRTLSDFLQGKCDIEETAYDVSSSMELKGPGALYLIPSSMTIEAITKIISDGYDAAALNEALIKLMETMKLDTLFIDTHPGLNKETMLITAICDVLMIIVRPDSQDYHGTALLVEVADRLSVPSVYLLANKVASRLIRLRISSRSRNEGCRR